MKKIIFILSLFLIVYSNAYAAVDLPWSTTFDCAEWIYTHDDMHPGCDGLDRALGTISPAAEQITTPANMAAGGGGRGQRHWECDGTNQQSGGLRIDFNSTQDEVWVRWYMRYQSGFAWSYLNYDKILYFNVSTPMEFVFEFLGSDSARFWSQGAQYGPSCSGCGWATIMGGSTSDGLWHCYEVHVKMDTNGSDGIAQAWVDEELILDASDFDFNTQSGWDFIMIGSNQKSPNNSQCEAVDFDDMAINNTGYIGPIGGGDETPPVISAPLPSGEQPCYEVIIQVTTDENATCKCDTSDVAYDSMSETFDVTTGVTTHQKTLSLANDSSYTYYIRCMDATGNKNTSSTSVSFSTAPALNGELFCEHFDDANVTTRGWYDFVEINPVDIDTTTKNTGLGAIEYAFDQTDTVPNYPGGAMRKAFSESESVYVSFYVKFEDIWRGSQQTYHPHLICLLSDLDGAYDGIAYNYLNTYIETLSDIGSPYAIRPQTAIQDGKRVNTGYGTPPQDLTETTEDRSVAYCNGCLSGSDCGDVKGCYLISGSSWSSSLAWTADSSEIPKDEWVHIEAYFQMNTISGNVAQPDGIMYYYVNDEKVINKTNIVYRTNQDSTKKWDKFIIAPYIGDGSPITQSFWIDDLRVGTDIPSGICTMIGTRLEGVRVD
ncbi:hypothetical protein KKH23_06300 [Patescibacteria group bacterium]|nr:hypothetical protein [Patescibacteria group bacterium]